MKDNVFKCFGISKSDVKSLLSPLMQDNKGVLISIDGQQLLIDVTIQADDNNVHFYDISREIFEKLNKYIYAESEISLEETAFELLKLHKLTLAVGESVTGGDLISSLIKKNPGASEIIVEGVVVYSNDAKMRRLGVSQQVLNSHTSVSVQTTHDMAKGLLKTTPADIVIATTGYAGSITSTSSSYINTSDTNSSNVSKSALSLPKTNGLSSNQDIGLVYIAIGDRGRIDVFKNKFYGTREEIIETTSASALFYLIKKLRKNDFVLDRNKV